ncbi:LOW QUALITY PROTEIN: trichohyalin-like protein 1 [Apodemus sylvaticus]|uniref:LOW QUALITY PROTEIN: trichohyalin-like protein 1 n=1 Tax=Apodemus sylvaticus TaxID=10129 RepID=UPI002244232A|nr:LOW QUALITY PROTEIN: trichohyalin-like protein 1 [Apodemus sylvaticus]
MSRLLRGIFCVVEIFHRYAGEDGDNQATLTRRELRQLLEGEIGDFLQPHVFRAMERKLNLLDFDRDDTISFEEFILAIFSLSNPSYFDISLLHSEPRLMSKSEKMDAVDFGAIAGNTKQVVGVGPTQERLIFPSEVASSDQPSNEEGEVGEEPTVSPREDIKTHSLSRNVSEPNDPENQQPKEDAQEVTQNVPATEYDGVQFKRNTGVQAPKQSPSPTQEIPGERSRPSRRQSDTVISDHMIQRPTEDEKYASSTQDPLLQKEDKATGSVHTGVPVIAATGKSSQTREVFEPTDDTRLSETQETGKDAGRIPPKPTNLKEPKADTRASQSHRLPAQEREQETRDQSVQSQSRNASETSSRGELEEEEARKEHEGITRSPEPEVETRDEKCQEFSGSWRENDAKKVSAVQEPNSKEGNQNLPEIKEESISGKEARNSEEDTVDAFAINRNSPAAEETLGTRERSQELAPLEKQSQGKKHGTTRTHDKPIRKQDHNVEEDPELSATQSDEGFCETPNSLAPEVGESSSEPAEPGVPGDSQSQLDHHGDAQQENYNNSPDPEKQGAPGESSREQGAVVLSIQEDGQLPEELDQPARERKHDGLSSRTKGGPGAAVEPSEGGEVQEATAGSENRKSIEAEGSEPNWKLLKLTEVTSQLVALVLKLLATCWALPTPSVLLIKWGAAAAVEETLQLALIELPLPFGWARALQISKDSIQYTDQH